MHRIPFLARLCCQSPEKPCSKLDHSCGFRLLVTRDVCAMHAIPWTQKSCKSWRDTNKNICIAPAQVIVSPWWPGTCSPHPECVSQPLSLPHVSDELLSLLSSLFKSAGAARLGLELEPGPGSELSWETAAVKSGAWHYYTGDMPQEKMIYRENYLFSLEIYCSDVIQ